MYKQGLAVTFLSVCPRHPRHEIPDVLVMWVQIGRASTNPSRANYKLRLSNE